MGTLIIQSTSAEMLEDTLLALEQVVNTITVLAISALSSHLTFACCWTTS